MAALNFYFFKISLRIYEIKQSFYSENKEKWIKEGSPISAPESLKISIIIDYYNAYKCNIFIET